MSRLDELKRYLDSRGWQWRSGKPIPYGEQLIIDDGVDQATLNFYPKRGRMVVGGAETPLKEALRAWAGVGEAGAPVAATIDEPHIGLDESGKGDWFGPLVVAAVRVDGPAAAALRRRGVRDSKALDTAAIRRLATEIAQIVPAPGRYVLAIAPEAYNRLYARHGNINLLLAEVYAEVAAHVWRAARTATIVCDQFSQRADRLERSFAAAGLPAPRQQHHAEASSIAVAAASILASAAFHEGLEQLGRAAGLAGPLPCGATATGSLETAARQIISQQGSEALGRYAKLNFRPVRELLG